MTILVSPVYPANSIPEPGSLLPGRQSKMLEGAFGYQTLVDGRVTRSALYVSEAFAAEARERLLTTKPDVAVAVDDDGWRRVLAPLKPGL